MPRPVGERRKKAIELRKEQRLATGEIARILGVSYPVAKRYVADFPLTEEEKRQRFLEATDQRWTGYVKKTKSIENQRASNRRHYARNKAYYVEKNSGRKAQYRKQIYAWLFEYFEKHPCVGCGETNPVVLEFDHRNGEKKKRHEVSVFIQNGNLKKVKQEVEKCDVRCANCHKKRTAVQHNWYWIEFLKIDSVAQRI